MSAACFSSSLKGCLYATTLAPPVALCHPYPTYILNLTPMTTNNDLTTSKWQTGSLPDLKKAMQRALRNALKAGHWLGKAPLGYRINRIEGKACIQADPAVAPLVQETFTLFATGSHSLQEALQIMTERGLTTSDGRPVGLFAFYKLLANPFYTGEMNYKGKRWPAVHEPLVDKNTFERVQQQLTTRKRP